MILPGGTIGIIGGGQLGRMLAMAAAKLGYRVHVFDPHDHPCAVDVADRFTQGEFTDETALAAFGTDVDVVTYEFENLPAAPLASIGSKLRPGTRSLEVAQDRAAEKDFIERSGGTVAPWRRIDCLTDVVDAVAALGCPIVLKTRRYGYDGKGQAWIRTPDEAAAAWAAIGEAPAVAERGMKFESEFSVILTRTEGGSAAFFPSPRNEHRDGILRHSVVPAGEDIEAQQDAARLMAKGIADALGHVGVLTVEFFACSDGPIVNEIAPRVHNSGHWTIEGAATSQFEQHIRAICGLPLGDTRLIGTGVVMDNLIGADVDSVPDLLMEAGASVHLYGKGEARHGRKMGHVTRIG